MVFETKDLSRHFPPKAERRHTRRLDHIFPVEFRFLGLDGQPAGEWRQAFTQDVGEGGLCVIVNQLHNEEVAQLRDPKTLLSVTLHIPLNAEAVMAVGRPMWLECLKEGLLNQYGFGVAYHEIDPKDRARLARTIGVRTFVKALAVTFWLILSLGLVAAGAFNLKLRVENERLLNGLSENAALQRTLSADRAALISKMDEMEFLLQQADRKINTLAWVNAAATQQERQEFGAMQSSMKYYKKYQAQLQKEIGELNAKRAAVDQVARAAAQEGGLLEKKIVDKLYNWLAAHQNTRSGLVTSFEGDEEIKDWAFTYDQALAAIVFTYGGEPARARQIFDYYQRARQIDGGAFVNAYYATGGEPAEFIAHVGPNVWLGLAVLQYTKKTGDDQYLGLARGIGQWLDGMRDEEGGLKGGRTVTWYATEHNLDAYAFYRMLHELVGDEQDRKRAEETLAWLNKNAYSRLSDPLIKRGKGDATVATDTYAWSISAIGPGRLKEAGMDPDEIMEFAISHCAVSVAYQKPEGTAVRVKGFDFAKSQNLARGGVVSCEWTAQMLLAFKIMARYYAQLGIDEKAEHYAAMGRDYVPELSKMMVTSPSPVGQGEFCLPYASHEMADTGHGWRTPRGNRTGSVAGTAYAILAIEGINPLAIENPCNDK